jgi:hypothetical protein
VNGDCYGQAELICHVCAAASRGQDPRRTDAGL